MDLAGQENRAEMGYAMAMLIVGLGIMTVLMSAAMPVWKQTAQREREEELVFRGGQYSRAIGLYQRKYANANPPSLDVLLEQKFLRKKFTDPMVADGEFQLLYQSNQTGAKPGPGQITVPTTTPTGGGIIGVTSKSTAESIRIYNGRTRYSEWQFTPVAQTQKAGAPQ